MTSPVRPALVPTDDEEVRDAIRAIRLGEVDAVVVAEEEADRVYLIEPAVRPYHALVERIAQGAMLLDAAGTVLYANARMAAMIDARPDALVGRPLDDLLAPGAAAGWREARAGAGREVELRHGGGPRPVRLDVDALGDDTWCAVVTDLTEHHARRQLEREIAERAQVEAELRARNAELEALHRGVPVGLCTIDGEGRVLRHNARLSRVLEAAGWDGEDTARVATELAPLVRRVFATGEPETDVEIAVPDARDPPDLRWWLCSCALVPGPVTVAQVAVLDVTARRRAERAKREAEARFRALAETVPDILFACDAEGRTEYVNARFREYAGRRRGSRGWLDVIHPDDLPACEAAWEAGLAERGPIELRCRLRARDGRYRWFRVHARPFVADRRTRWFGVCTDIDDLVQAEQALREADQRKDRFLVTLAHELRNPLSPIRDAATWLDRRGADTPEAQRARATIQRQVTHLARLVDDLLDLSRIARGTLLLRRERCDLAALVRATVEDARHTVEGRGIALRCEVPAGGAWVEGDATRLSEVVHNLLHNAVKFTDRGGAIDVGVRHDPADGAVTLLVRDTGVGLDAGRLERVFEPFRQEVDRQRGGLGLGLPLVRGIVELHGGRVVARSDGAGRGTAFEVTLPAADAPTGLPPRRAAPAPGTPRRVLVVEDSRDTAEMLRGLLELDGHVVATASAADAGYELARAFRPDVVLCDIGLDGEHDGYHFARLLRADPELCPVVLIALTGHGRDSDLRAAAEAGFDHHLVKPAEYDEICALIAAAPVLGSGQPFQT